MIHARTDNAEWNRDARFACGLGWPLPTGDKYFGSDEEPAYRHVDCPACRAALEWGERPNTLGTKFSEMTPKRFREIARSWGYD